MFAKCEQVNGKLLAGSAAEAKFTDVDLETVVGLLDGPGVVKELNFGTYTLLRPEWNNAYAQAMERTQFRSRLI